MKGPHFFAEYEAAALAEAVGWPFKSDCASDFDMDKSSIKRGGLEDSAAFKSEMENGCSDGDSSESESELESRGVN